MPTATCGRSRNNSPAAAYRRNFSPDWMASPCNPARRGCRNIRRSSTGPPRSRLRYCAPFHPPRSSRPRGSSRPGIRRLALSPQDRTSGYLPHRAPRVRKHARLKNAAAGSRTAMHRRGAPSRGRPVCRKPILQLAANPQNPLISGIYVTSGREELAGGNGAAARIFGAVPGGGAAEAKRPCLNTRVESAVGRDPGVSRPQDDGNGFSAGRRKNCAAGSSGAPWHSGMN